MKDKEYHMTNFATFVSKPLFSPQKMDEFNLKPAQCCINKIFEPTKSSICGQFQNGCNKVVVEPCVVQFWSEIILVISNRTRIAHFDIEFTCMILAQIALHSVHYHYKAA